VLCGRTMIVPVLRRMNTYVVIVNKVPSAPVVW
jgi:hypothetical protein